MIASGIPLAMYRPLDRKLSRVKLGLPDDGRPLVLVSAHNLTDRRKGGGILPELLRELQTRPMVLIFMGQGVIPVDSPGITTISLGFVNDPAAQAEIYSAVDLMLHPAPVDNLPNVIIESLACGTPVVAYPIGGVPEMILPGVTGWLAANFGARGLAQTLDRACWQIRGGLSLRESCRSFASEHFDDQDRAADYEDLFENLVGDFPTIEPNRPFRLPFRPSPHRQAG
jgi:glycosyltransferase involved in cell wall biosynthesis